MDGYKKPNPEIWTGRKSGHEMYLHEKVQCVPFDKMVANTTAKTFALMGYACDEGVRRNHGRIGAVKGPDEIRKALAKFPNHLHGETQFLDVGTIECVHNDLETAQADLAEKVSQLLEGNMFPIILGGGHDIAYGHFNGIKKHVGKDKTIGIINFDAHFDLRSNAEGSNSGTPFYQIAKECKADGAAFSYLCLGIRKDANTKILFQRAEELGVSYLGNNLFTMHYWEKVKRELLQFIKKVDYIYTTIDLDGFSSAYAPGVSAPYPTGFSPDIVFETLQFIIDSKKLISLDVAEMNPSYDIDNRTAKLAASLVHFAVHTPSVKSS